MSNKSEENLWTPPMVENIPPKIFFNDQEKKFQKGVSEELLERVIGQPILYYPISIEHTNFHPLYGESVNKIFLPPIRVYVLVNWEGYKTSYTNGRLDRTPTIKINFHKRRLTEDQELFTREGDYVLYFETLYEIVSLNEPRVIWGDQRQKMEIEATCIKARISTMDIGQPTS